MEADSDKKYAVFRKTFHVPKEWLKKEQFQYLINHRYVVEQGMDALRNIQRCFEELDYMEVNNKMIHDYLHFMIKDMLDKNGEVYITEDDIRASSIILQHFKGMTPDFVIRRGKALERTMILDVYTGDRQPSEQKNKYRKFEYFADICVVTTHDFQQHLVPLLSKEDTDYLYKHFQIFMTEYHYWRACIKLKKIILNEAINVPIRRLCQLKSRLRISSTLPTLALISQRQSIFPDRTLEQESEVEQYITDLTDYAKSVAAQERI